MKKRYFKVIWKELELSIPIVSIVLSILLAIIPIVIKCNLVQIITSCSLVAVVFLIFVSIVNKKYSEYKKTKKISIKFGDSKVNIYYGDIFSADNEGFNYLDTIRDTDDLESHKSFNVYLDQSIKIGDGNELSNTNINSGDKNGKK